MTLTSDPHPYKVLGCAILLKALKDYVGLRRAGIIRNGRTSTIKNDEEFLTRGYRHREDVDDLCDFVRDGGFERGVDFFNLSRLNSDILREQAMSKGETMDRLLKHLDGVQL